MRATAQWLVCKDVCIPETGSFELRLPVVAAGTTPGGTAHSAMFERATAARSLPLQGWTAEVQQSERDVLLTLQADGDRPLPVALPEVHFFPFAEQLVDPAVHELKRTPRGYALKMRLMADAKVPAQLQGVAVAQAATGAAWGTASPQVEFSAPWREVAALTWPEGAQPVAAKAVALAGTSGEAARTGLVTALLLAFVGGMLLNLMPCVFPVLSIKLLGLTKQSKDPAALRTHALAYGAGVLVTFLALAAALIALAGRRQRGGLGLPAAGARRGLRAGLAVLRHRAEPDGHVGVRQPGAAAPDAVQRTQPRRRRLRLRRAGRGGGAAPAPRPSWGPRWAMP